MLTVPGRRFLLHIMMSERPPFVSLLLVPEQFLSQWQRAAELVRWWVEMKGNWLGRDDPLCSSFPCLWELMIDSVMAKLSSSLAKVYQCVYEGSSPEPAFSGLSQAGDILLEWKHSIWWRILHNRHSDEGSSYSFFMGLAKILNLSESHASSVNLR